jgi:hypothetical protein
LSIYTIIITANHGNPKIKKIKRIFKGRSRWWTLIELHTKSERERESRNNIRGSLKEEGGELPDVKSVKILLARLSKHDIPQFIFIKS